MDKERGMTSGSFSGHHVLCIFSRLSAAAALLFTAAWAESASAAANDAEKAQAQRQIAGAAEAEIGGDTVRRLALLQDALRHDPDNSTARWQLGQIQRGGNWITVEEAQRRAAADPIQAEYQLRRTTSDPGFKSQRSLARWCSQSDLSSEAQFHWATVLLLDPNNNEALKATDTCWKNGQLVKRSEIKQQQIQARAAKEAAKYWQPIVAKWRRAVAGHDVPAHDAALNEIRHITRADAIPTLETVTLGRDAFDVQHAEECLQITLALLEALEKMPTETATESLVRHAVFSPGKKAHKSAIEKLKQRPLNDFVPALVGNLMMPLESSYQLKTDRDGSVHYSHSLYREGQDADWEYNSSQSVMRRPGSVVNVALKRRITAVNVLATARRAWQVPPTAVTQAAIASTVADIESRVWEVNQADEALNERIIPVLAETTDKNFLSAKQWWDWWRESNEYYVYDHPVWQENYSQSNGCCVVIVNCSCFVQGTPVWTKTGLKPIETLSGGDLVLSQDVKSGELSYKPVIARTVRPASPILKISLDNEQLQTTKGHPFWVAGVGWRMAKELGDGARLHGVTGGSQIRSIEPASDAEAYNLVVADFNTYFVGETGVLVHDNTPRRPAQVLLPGIAVK
jgi:hypothetical protein